MDRETWKRRPYLVVAVAALVVGLALTVTARVLKSHALDTETWPQVQGVVLESKTAPPSRRRPGEGRGTYKVHISYRYEVGGRRYKNEVKWTRGDRAKAESTVAAYRANTPIDVFYDPYDPGTSVLMRGDLTSTYLTMIGGSLVLAFAPCLYYVDRTRARLAEVRAWLLGVVFVLTFLLAAVLSVLVIEL